MSQPQQPRVIKSPFSMSTDEEPNFLDLRPKVIEVDPKGSSAQASVSGSPPEVERRSSIAPSKKANTISPLVDPTELMDSLPDKPADPAPVVREELAKPPIDPMPPSGSPMIPGN